MASQKLNTCSSTQKQILLAFITKKNLNVNEIHKSKKMLFYNIPFFNKANGFLLMRGWMHKYRNGDL